MSIEREADHQIRKVLAAYCERFDRGDFAGFAQLFERGQWGFVATPGASPVMSFIRENVLLYDGLPRTRHTITNVEVDVADGADVAGFRCYVEIWQHRSDGPPELLVHARFHGDFVSDGGRWWWRTHTVIPDFIGDLGRHMKAGPE